MPAREWSRQRLANACGNGLANVFDGAAVPLRKRAAIALAFDLRRGERVADGADGIEPCRARVIEAAGKRRFRGRRQVCLYAGYGRRARPRDRADIVRTRTTAGVCSGARPAMLGDSIVRRWPRGIFASTIVTVPVISTPWRAFVSTGARTASTRSFAIANPAPTRTSAIITVAASVPAANGQAQNERQREGRERDDRRGLDRNREVGRDAGAEANRSPKEKSSPLRLEMKRSAADPALGERRKSDLFP